MSIIRAPRPESGFYVLDKKISEDKRLSWAARGLLIFLLGKPDHWRVSTQHLINETAESDKPLGRDAVRALMAELIKAGYLRRVLARGEAGKLGGYDYEVSEVWALPEPAEPAPPQPATEKPGPVEPAPANPPLVRTDGKQELICSKNGKKQSAAGAPAAESLPDWLPADRWEAFRTMRVKIKAPMTEEAERLAVLKLETLRATGHDPVAVINQSIEMSWRGLFPVKAGAAGPAAVVAGETPAQAAKRQRLSELTGGYAVAPPAAAAFASLPMPTPALPSFPGGDSEVIDV